MSGVEALPSGPRPGVKYPLQVDYCENCSMPLEFCEYYPDYEGCKKWLEKTMPDKFAALGLNGEEDGGDEEAKKRQKRGGKGMLKAKKKDQDIEKKISLFIAPRGKRKAVTVVQGLKTFGVDLKVASKFFGQKFACGSSITGDDEIVIQGDFKDDLFDLIPEKWSEVDEDLIDDLGEKKRT
ncbi:density-regulated protein homolog [Lepeophtheirus salmonis]|uniref:Density-regulated protein homolog n=1 Tax=Lepeophtheirus salmonis TaxID=72036 RepID=C1BSG3_LEPSM|nr:density-regulated protein homolog [Lepeophtheirus salmonis]XP_040578775.1 density-regulated protein homolog [Lepeophtheirus salmonis]ACO11966.1 Density-regulated protein [Lepeophtheirus salmonis]